MLILWAILLPLNLSSPSKQFAVFTILGFYCERYKQSLSGQLLLFLQFPLLVQITDPGIIIL